ncbi:MAG: type IV-A pilus assembly ATPase PilB [Gammaproteobacteria bacterium]|nr:type IV-A pilus assembly ATPase PilB [Gammaproteobacteria bacterium]
MAVPSANVPLTGLARKLVADKLLDQKVAQEAWVQASREKIPFVTHVVGKGLIKGDVVAQIAADEFGVPLIDLNAVDIDPDVTRLVQEKLIRDNHALPLYKRGTRLYVAVSDPTNLQALDEMKFASGAQAEPVIVEDDKLLRTIDKALEAVDTSMNMGEGDDLEDLEGLEVADEGSDDDPASLDVDDAPVVKFVNKLLLDCMKKGASDIHIEPYEKFCRVRLRIDGVLQEVAKPPLALSTKITARVKVMARLDVSERRVPQDGRIKLKLSKTKAIDFRVSTCPTLFGEKTVLRLLDSSMSIPLEALGYEDFQLRIFLRNLKKPYGMFLVTGPTGSGKTVSLYSGINLLNKPDINISTAEDPVEINLPGVNQVQIDERTGMTFEKALKAFLRQDPDIILVGEIRDLLTGNIAVKAAQTGHMVMATLHTNDAPQTLTRMVDMGIKPYAIATAVNVITAQRLGRRLCGNCKEPMDVPKKALLKEGFSEKDIADPNFRVFHPKGCDQCTNGYKGRVGIYQVMEVSEEMERMVMEGRNAIDIADQARREGIPDLRQSGLKKVKDGVLSIEEMNRVTQE